MSLDSAFLQRSAPLPIIETQKSHWNASGVDSRETGLFPEKKTSLSCRIVSLLSHVSVVPCPGPHPYFHVLTTSPRHPDSGIFFFLFAVASKSADTR